MAREKLATIEELESASDEEEAPELEINFQQDGGMDQPEETEEENEAPNNELDEE